MAGYRARAKEMSSADVFSVLHKIADEENFFRFRWEPLKWGFEYVYCQERLYFIRDHESRAMYLIHGASPLDALYRLSDRLENLGGEL